MVRSKAYNKTTGKHFDLGLQKRRFLKGDCMEHRAQIFRNSIAILSELNGLEGLLCCKSALEIFLCFNQCQNGGIYYFEAVTSS